MQVLTNLHALIQQIEQSVTQIGFAIATLFGVIASIRILTNGDNSPGARTERYAQLKTVFFCTFIIAAIGPFITFATSLGKMI